MAPSGRRKTRFGCVVVVVEAAAAAAVVVVSVAGCDCFCYRTAFLRLGAGFVCVPAGPLNYGAVRIACMVMFGDRPAGNACVHPARRPDSTSAHIRVFPFALLVNEVKDRSLLQ